MIIASLIHYLLPILTVLLASTFLLITASHLTPPPSSPAPGGCADSVISFSPCLPYISAPPNDLSDDPSSQCCDIYDGAFDSGEAECLCYLVRQSTLLGFPINASKLLSLSDLCALSNNSQANNTDLSLQSICSGSPTLPPLLSTTKKPHSGSHAPLPPSATTIPSSAKNASRPVRPPTSRPSTSKQRNNGNYPKPSYAIDLLSICWYFLIKFQ
ncbi:putative lipid-binding protein At4g00165 [Cynara cardunculus var. scolymus]|uniref:Bifunctional inhibitor/plant lipid transfer protein/seed storage helical domain-containing protein n=1 Tax=Cynara cardunculus var. scolymus TaxID=59895 RepID=A0A103YLJ9_CYNCS|nr:putative lipid-binding protein At4g00165 [Cynara cardunculus var. scolymus]KVI11322.1 Bifunctional inhibitor/plant lipid transfer protein/seed storage helical domain-containing protein [Cynara cardunculus var. scolymus]